jgi:hypothetical protein
MIPLKEGGFEGLYKIASNPMLLVTASHKNPLSKENISILF